ncbi:DUF5995 family protein [Streptomyces sp. XM4193]|uniref:DUF5995 family protein n=1 Tax=Streptomyces sp. XM4193 TaxID=2929782 RepID=UPI001FFA73A6|nr:DUF5995 family protein [Streptomyces sp. XM4193]MCK1797794.1 DUF5995 family protein [Streptomyces sp. XM4193]
MPDPLVRLRIRAAALAPEDGIAVCAGVLLAAVDDPEGVAEAPHARALARELADRLLAALDAEARGDPLAACWRPVFRLRRHPRLTPLQFALAGLNAQFGYDVPLALIGSTARLSGGELGAVEREFHRAAQPLLLALDDAVHDWLAPHWSALRVADPLTHLVGVWNADRARQEALTSCRLYAQLAERPTGAAEFTEQLAARAGTVAALLLTPLTHPQ